MPFCDECDKFAVTTEPITFEVDGGYNILDLCDPCVENLEG